MMKNVPLAHVTNRTLETFRHEISRCVKCGSCQSVCPSFLLHKRESFSARGRIALIKAVLEGRLTVSSIYKDRLVTCLGCMACEQICANGVPVTEIMQAAKMQAVEESGAGIIGTVVSEVLKRPALFRAAAWLAPIALHYSNERDETRLRRSADCGAGIEKGHKQGLKSTIAFFPGCAAEYFQPEILRATAAVLNRLGFDLIVPRALKCCGRPLLSLGDRKASEQIAAENISVFAKIEADAIVTACASCSLTFKREYPKLLPPEMKMPAFIDIHEFIFANLSKLNFKPIKKTVTWHDPCHLDRGQGISATPRDILRAIPGLTFVEMKNADRCCGFGGVMRITHGAESNLIADEKVKSILFTGASAVVTGCPSCCTQIVDGLKRAGSDVEVIHTLQLLDKAL